MEKSILLSVSLEYDLLFIAIKLFFYGHLHDNSKHIWNEEFFFCSIIMYGINILGMICSLFLCFAIRNISNNYVLKYKYVHYYCWA